VNMAPKGNLTVMNLMNEKSLKSQLAVVNVTIFSVQSSGCSYL